MTRLRWQRITEHMAECENGAIYVVGEDKGVGILTRNSGTEKFLPIILGVETPLEALDRITGTTWPPEDATAGYNAVERTPPPGMRGF